MTRFLLSCILIALLTGPGSLKGQIDSSSINTSPYGVIYNHLYYLQPDNYLPSRAALSLPADIVERDEKAIQLKQVLDGKGLFIDLNRMPRQRNYVDSLSMESIYFLDRKEPKIYLEKIDEKWLYSRTTLESLEVMHQKLYPFGTQFVTYFQAPVWQVGMLGIKLWKWLAIVLMLFLSTVIFYVLKWSSSAIFRRFLKNRLVLDETAERSLHIITRLIGISVGIRFLHYFLPMLQLTPKLTYGALRILNVLGLFLIILILRHCISIFFTYLDKAAKKTENTMDDQLLPVLQKLTIIFLWAIGLIYILDYLDVNVTALLAGISIGGLALALAAQDTVKNFFGSIMIFLDKPFQIGDWIHFKDIDGSVEEVGVRSTRIRTFANSLTYVPNALLADSVIDNMGLRVYRRFKTDVGITYDTPPELIEKFVDGIRKIVALHPGTRKDYYEVHLNSFGPYSINILIYMFFETPSWTDELRGKHDILYAIIKLADTLGVRFAFPTQTLHIEEMAQAGIPNKPFPKRNEQTDTDMDRLLKEMDQYFSRERS